MSEEKKLPGGYRIIIIDVDEDKIVEDQIVSAVIGAYAKIVNKEMGLVGAHEFMACKSTPVTMAQTLKACEDVIEKAKEKIATSVLEKMGDEEKLELLRRMMRGEN